MPLLGLQRLVYPVDTITGAFCDVFAADITFVSWFVFGMWMWSLWLMWTTHPVLAPLGVVVFLPSSWAQLVALAHRHHKWWLLRRIATAPVFVQ